ncbi:hypothetical protein V6N11_050886 [Hibiscus sabdariffa]|uniref:Uncharacterized protein n=1 Tax=Hibiscus sabdariffa TaxID=183260 RepID=A0ABR2TBW8_9ROSI
MIPRGVLRDQHEWHGLLDRWVMYSYHSNTPPTAAAVVVTDLIGANFVQAALDKLRFRDPIACTWIGNTAALSAKEPEALPFCAIAYGLAGIFGSLFCSV